MILILCGLSLLLRALLIEFDEGESILILQLLAGSGQILFWSIFGSTYGP